MLYQQLKPDHPDLSLGTVYRNLTLFREQGMVRGVGVVDGHIHRAAVEGVEDFQIFDFFLFGFLGHRICKWWVGGWQTGGVWF